VVNYTKKAVKGAGITLIFSIVASLVAYLVRVVLARNLEPADYGLFYAVFTFVIFFLFFRDLGLGQALIKYVAEFRAQGKFNDIKTAIVAVFSMQFTSSLVFGIFFFLMADYLGEHYFKSAAAPLLLKILVGYVLLSILFIIVKQTFNGFQHMFLFSSVEFLKNVIVLTLAVIFIRLGYKELSPVLAFTLACPLLFLIYLPFLLQKFKFFRYKIEHFFATSKKLLLFGIPVFATDVGGKIIGYIDTLILTNYRSLTEVGIYNVVLPSALIFLFFAKAVSAVMLPISSELWVKGEKGKLAEGLRILHKYSFVFIVPIILGVIYYAELLLGLFFGPKYAVGFPALQLILTGVIFYVVASANNSLIVGIGKPKTVTVLVIISAGVNTILNFMFIPNYGILGAALATTVSYLILLILSTYKATKYVNSRFPWKEWLKLIFPAGCFFGIIYLTEKSMFLNPYLELVISITIASFIYLLLIYAMKILVIKEVRYYTNRIFRKND
jgi:O-antigen/teichoic acid export membrane protein